MNPTELLARIDEMCKEFDSLHPIVRVTLGEGLLRHHEKNLIRIVDDLGSIRTLLRAMTDGRPAMLEVGNGYFLECVAAGRWSEKVSIIAPDDASALKMDELKLIRDWLNPSAVQKVRDWIDSAIAFHEKAEG